MTTMHAASGLVVLRADGTPGVEPVFVEDIARGLAHQARFNGQTAYHYSVAQHSWLVADQLEVVGASRDLQLQGLLHDAAEAYIGDLTRPVQRLMGSEWTRHAKDIEEGILVEIFRSLHPKVVWPHDQNVAEADETVIQDEVRHFFGGEKDIRFQYYPPSVAQRTFQSRLEFLREEVYGEAHSARH